MATGSGMRLSTASNVAAGSGRTAGVVRTGGSLTASQGGGLTSATQALVSGPSASALGTTFGQGAGASSLRAGTQGFVTGPFGPSGFHSYTSVNSALGVAGSAAGGCALIVLDHLACWPCLLLCPLPTSH